MGVISKIREWLLLRRVEVEIKKDPWFHSVLKLSQRILNDPEYTGDNPIVNYLQNDASQFLREKYATELSGILLGIAHSNNRIHNCRNWIFQVCEDYSSLRVLMLSPDESTKEAAGAMYHPCVTGLHNHLDELLRKDEELREICRREGGIPEAREFIRITSLMKHLELRIADHGRRELGDVPGEKRDWLTPLLNSMCALVESDYRRTLHLPSLCDSLSIFEEQVTLQKNLLACYKDPLEGVPFACRSDGDTH